MPSREVNGDLTDGESDVGLERPQPTLKRKGRIPCRVTWCECGPQRGNVVRDRAPTNLSSSSRARAISPATSGCGAWIWFDSEITLRCKPLNPQGELRGVGYPGFEPIIFPTNVMEDRLQPHLGIEGGGSLDLSTKL